jgi:TRAP-type C4-dicarboxylate transport system permease small subunit
MIATCAVLVTCFSSTAFVGLALGKETHSDFDTDEMRRLLPVQNGSAVSNIADICRGLLEERRQ